MLRHLRVLVQSLALSLLLTNSPSTAAKSGVAMSREGALVYLANDRIRLGVDLSKGGSIVYLSRAASLMSVINNHDLGRQVQSSFYSGPKPFGHPSPHWTGWGWNPIQSGDVYGNGAKADAWTFKNRTLYVRTTPLQWALSGARCECWLESWISLRSNQVHVTSRLVNRRADHAQYSAEEQELPAVYTIGRLRRLVSYTGDHPFTDGPVTQLPNSFPWTTWRATESWAAYVDESGWGLGVINPHSESFGGGFYGPHADGGPSDAQTGFLRPGLKEVIDYNITYTYDYTLVLGTVNQIRATARALKLPDSRPHYIFKRDRQHWTYMNASDGGWPVKGSLEVKTNSTDPQMISPYRQFAASSVPTLYIRAAFSGRGGEAQLFWATSKAPEFSEAKSIRFPVVPDGSLRSYHLDLAGQPSWKGNIIALRFDPPGGGPAGKMEICAISWQKIAC
jgi:hypothetical protein